MSFDPIEGIDYIFDRYAFLQRTIHKSIVQKLFQNDFTKMEQAILFVELPPYDFLKKLQEAFPDEVPDMEILSITPESPDDDIREAITIGRAANHPDRYRNADIDAQKKAGWRRDLLDKCRDILLNSDVRPLYNERLQRFMHEKPGFISPSGAAIVDLHRERFSLDALLSDEIPDTRAFEQRAQAMLQHDEAKFLQAEALYRAMPENGMIKNMYKDALSKKLTFLTILEDAAWSKLGYGVKKKHTEGLLVHAADYVARVEDELNRVKSRVIEDSVTERSDTLRIGMGMSPLLLEDQSHYDEQQNLPQKTEGLSALRQEFIKAKARHNLEIRAEYVREIANKKQETFHELVTLSDRSDLTPRDPNSPLYDVFLVNPDDSESILIHFTVNAEDCSSTMDKAYMPGVLPLEKLKESLTEDSRNVVIVKHNPDISEFVPEPVYVISTLIDDWQERKKMKPSPVPAI